MQEREQVPSNWKKQFEVQEFLLKHVEQGSGEMLIEDETCLRGGVEPHHGSKEIEQ